MGLTDIAHKLAGVFQRGHTHQDNDVEYKPLSEQQNDGENDEDLAVLEPDLLGEDEKRSREQTLEQIQETSGETSTLQAAWNITNLIQGTGTLGLPFAVARGGLVSLVAMLVIAIMTNYTGKLIIECVYDKRDSEDPNKRGVRARTSYGQIGKACWKYGEEIVSGIQLLHLFCACVLYLMLVADFFDEVFHASSMPLPAWTAVAGILMLPLVFLNKLVVISWLSMFSVIAILNVFVLVLGYGIYHDRQWRYTGLPFIDVSGLPVSCAIILFSCVCHPYLPNIEQNMREPASFNKIMDGSFLMATTLKAAFSYICVLTFWDAGIQQEISENLPHGLFKMTVETLLGLNGLLSFALPAFTFINIVHKCKISFLPPCFSDEQQQLSCRQILINVFLRTLLVSSSILVAAYIPQFSLMMAVIGSITASSLTLIFPCTFHIILNRDTLSRLELATDMSIIAFGVFSGIVGLIFSVREMVLYQHTQGG